MADPSNYPRATRKRKMRTNKKMWVPLYPKQRTDPPAMKRMKVVRKTAKTP